MQVHGTKKKKILICGLPGSGKSTLANKLAPMLGAEWLNADAVRKAADDWDFSPEGRIRQANRMKAQAEAITSHNRHVVADFVCPTEKTRQDFGADYIVWMDTIKEGRFDDTNKMFVAPENYDYKVTHMNAEMWAFLIKQDFLNKEETDVGQ
jgi:adenylylsulfate kinase